MHWHAAMAAGVLLVAVATGLAQERASAVPGVEVGGELRRWHKVTLTIDGPPGDERARDPNPFRDYRLTVTFTHESGAPSYQVPGYFAGDGNAAATSATAGNKWRAHLSPDKEGRWDWRIAFVHGTDVAVDARAAAAAQPVAPFDGRSGSFRIAATNKPAPDFRSRGRLEYVGGHHLRFAGTGEYFLKVGADSPETLLAYADFDDTTAMKQVVPVHTYASHVADWMPGDPTWKSGKGKGLIGAINYLASRGVNALSFLSYNAGGDGDNVWPFVHRDDKLHFDVSKLDQWQVVFDHAQRKGLYLHFKLQETENDDNYRGDYRDGRPKGGFDSSASTSAYAVTVPTSLDGGALGPERKLYLREIVARFGYLLALNWNLGEENTQSTAQQREMADYIRRVDPYAHHIVIHTHPHGQHQIYPALLGEQSVLTGASLQNDWQVVHDRTLHWLAASRRAGRPWVVANDEQGDALSGVPPDPGYKGFAGKDERGRVVQTIHDIRKMTLWGNLMAGGAGVEYYFGYLLPNNDLTGEDFRSREQSWAYGRLALEFFRTQKIPFWAMTNADALVADADGPTAWCLAKAREIYVIYLPAGGTTRLDLGGASGPFTVGWFDPRQGGPLKKGSLTSVTGGGQVGLGEPPDSPAEDWVALVRR